MQRVSSVGFLLSALLTQGLVAQTPTPPPVATHSVVRFFKCSPQNEGVRLLQRSWPIALQMVAEGKFVDYGILAHSWGDEWNVVDFFVVAGIDTFFGKFSEFGRRAREADAQAPPPESPLRPFDEVCREHKDVIYSVVAPPAGG